MFCFSARRAATHRGVDAVVVVAAAVAVVADDEADDDETNDDDGDDDDDGNRATRTAMDIDFHRRRLTAVVAGYRRVSASDPRTDRK